MANVYHNVIRSFPKSYSLAFAYGSGVMRQLGTPSVSGKMMDFIFAVKDPLQWHRDNIHLNPSHYSSLRLLGPSTVDNVQTNWGAKVYYNTLVPTHEGMIKYGVISSCDLITDLMDWDTLYVAGRLHKPVKMLHKGADDHELRRALSVNLQSAVHTALLLLPDLFTQEQFYAQLVGLSYKGDFRMYVSEDPLKVQNIVGGQLAELRAIYEPILATMTDYVLIDQATGQGMQDTEALAKHYHLSRLPSGLQEALVRECNRDGRNRDLEDVLRAVAQDPDSADLVHDGVSSIVSKAGLSQAVKGVITAGAWKALRYAAAKVNKKISIYR